MASVAPPAADEPVAAPRDEGVASVAPPPDEPVAAPSGEGVASVAPPAAAEPAPPARDDDAPSVAPSVPFALPGLGVPMPALGEVSRRGEPAARKPVNAWMIRAAAEDAGLKLPERVYVNVAAALASGKHLILTGAPGAGKTMLALAIARTAAQAGEASGATVVAATDADHELVVEAAVAGRWLIVDELDRARPDDAFGALSAFLAGIPIHRPGSGEAMPAEGWRLVATWGAGTPQASTAVLRRFAVIEVSAPDEYHLLDAIADAAGGDKVAAAAAERLLPARELAPFGAGVFLDAARHGAARRAATPVDENVLSRELFAIYVQPLLGELDEAARRRVRELWG